MNKIEQKFFAIRKFCQENADPALVKKYERYFTEGYDAYGMGQETLHNQRDAWLEEWKNEMTFDDYLLLGDKLVSTGKYEEASFAISLVSLMKDQYKVDTFHRMGDWLETGLRNWGHTDATCSLITPYFIEAGIVQIEDFLEWNKSPSKWKRRAVPVTMIDPLKNGMPLNRILVVIEPIMLDAEKFVQKGLGWFLREAWKIYREETEDFLLKWKDTCGRTIIQYATEKMSKHERLRFRRAKR